MTATGMVDNVKSAGGKIGKLIPGWMWMVFAAMQFCAMGMLVKFALSRGAGIFWVGWFRFFLGGLIVFLSSLFGACSLKVHNKKAFVLRGAIGSMGQFFLFVAIAYVGLGRGTVLVYLLGVVSTIAAVFILKEKPSLLLVLSVFAATGGVFLACGASFPSGHEWLALVGALFTGLAVVLVRMLRRTDSNNVSLYSQCLFGALILTVPALATSAPGALSAWACMILLTLIDMGGQLCMSQGLSSVSAARGAALLMLTPVLSVFVGFAWYGEALSPVQMAGCALVVVASLMAVASRNPSVG